MTDNEIYISDKDIGNYIGAAVKQLNENDSVSILSRGQENNGKAIDVAVIVRRDEDASIEDVTLETKEFTNEDGEEHRVSGIEIYMEA